MQFVRVLSLVALGAFAVPMMAQPQGRPMQGGGGRPPMGGMRGGGRSPKMRLPRVVESAAHLSGANALTKKQARQMVKLVTPWRMRPTMSDAAAQTLFTSLSGTLTAAQKTALQGERGEGRGPGGGGPGGRNGGPGGGGPGGRMGGPGGGGPGGRMGGPGGGGRMGGPGGGGRMGGPGGGGRMGGPGGGGGRPDQGQMEKFRSMMASYNPLYSGTPAGMSSLPASFKEVMEKRRDRLNAALSQLQLKAR